MPVEQHVSGGEGKLTILDVVDGDLVADAACVGRFFLLLAPDADTPQLAGGAGLIVGLRQLSYTAHGSLLIGRVRTLQIHRHCPWK